jgi:glycosyltransferase involved in cell wall biosynthesis
MTSVIGIDARSALGQPAGVGRYVRHLVRHLSRLAPDLRLVLFVDRHGASVLPDAPANVQQRALTLPALQNGFTWLHLRLPPELWRRPVDLFHYPFYTMPLVGGRPAVVTIHDVTFELHPEWFSARSWLATRCVARHAARRAAAVLTVSERSRRDILDCYGVDPGRVHAVHPGVDPDWAGGGAPPGAARRLGVDGPYVLHVGSIHTRRNIPRLLDAVARLRRRGSDLSLVLAGKVEYPYPDVGAWIAEAGLAGTAVHAGWLPDPEIATLYREARVVAYPSLYEGFGFPALEAMAAGTPVVAADGSCFPEVLGDAAILVDPHDVEAIADGIARAAADGEERRALVERGRRRVARYSWERTARRTLEVYRAVLGSAHG